MSEFIGYYKSNPPRIVDAHGRVIISEVKIISVKKLPLSAWVSDKLLYIRFRYRGKIWSGSTPGNSMYVKARPTKLKGL